MRILILNQFFYPDVAATAQILTDLTRALTAQGHHVRVICGRSSYTGEDREHLSESPAVEVVYAAGVPFARTLFGRVASYFSYLIGAAWHSLRGPRPDLVVTLTTPPGLCMIGSLLKIVSGSRHFIWEMDVYPDIAVSLGVIGARSWTARLVGRCLDASRRKADGIIVLSQTMRSRLANRGIPPDRLHVAENWADGQEIYPQPFPEWRSLRILYSGNFGLAHDALTIRAAVEHFASDARFHFSFAGTGSQCPPLDELRRQQSISNMSFAGYSPRQDLSTHLGECHIGLVTQKAVTVGAIVPSKTYGLLAAGRPLLYIGPKEGTPARIIEQFRCGWQVTPGDRAALIDLLEHLAANPAEVAEAGARGREAFLRNYDVRIGVARICAILELSQPEAVESAALAAKEEGR